MAPAGQDVERQTGTCSGPRRRQAAHGRRGNGVGLGIDMEEKVEVYVSSGEGRQVWFVVGQGHFRESSGLELQPGALGIRGEVPQLEEEGVVVGEEALLCLGSMCAAGQFPGTRWDDHISAQRKRDGEAEEEDVG